MKKLAVILWILLSCIGCDQGTKSVARSYLPRQERRSFLADTVRFEHVYNSGAFLGLGSSLPEDWRFPIFAAGSGALMLMLLTYLLFGSQMGTIQVLAFSLICGGGISNLIDRMLYHGSVMDFINIGIGALRTGIFNVADVAITTGVVLIFLSSVVFRSRDVPHGR